MEFRIAATFTESLARLTAQEQKAVKTTAFDLRLYASARGLSFHKLDRAVDKNFWSVRVNADITTFLTSSPCQPAKSLRKAFAEFHQTSIVRKTGALEGTFQAD
jgi:hypothetical protein